MRRDERRGSRGEEEGGRRRRERIRLEREEWRGA